MQFYLSLPGETVFGWQRLLDLPALAARFGVRLALVHGGQSSAASGLLERIGAMLTAAGITVVSLPGLAHEPEPDDVDAAVGIARDADVQGVIAVGGGSVIDLGKAIAALVPQHLVYPVRAYLEGVGEGRTLEVDPLPLLAIPTTAGTGCEATKNAVISSRREGFKKSLRDRRMIADIALIDPELTVGLPPTLTAQTGMDALTQLIEAYTSSKAQPVTDGLALRGLEAARLLPEAYHDGSNRDAREAMSLAAYLSGVCLANAGLGAAHGIAAALGSVTEISHGLACALALPWVMVANLPTVAVRYARIAEVLTGRHFDDVDTGAWAAVEYVWDVLSRTGIPRVAHLPNVAEAMQEDRLAALAQLCHGNSLRGNPRLLSDADLVCLLRAMRERDTPMGMTV